MILDAYAINGNNMKFVYRIGMGDTKIIPDLDVEKFAVIIRSSKFYQKQPDVINDLWEKCKKPIYHLTSRTKCFGLGDKGITAYFSDNCTQEDSDRVTEWLKLKNVCAFHCRTFKSEVDGRIIYDTKLASIEQGDKDGVTIPAEEYKGYTFMISRGDYSRLFEQVNSNLALAKEYAANDNQVQMIENYIKSFTDGNLNLHKEGSRYTESHAIVDNDLLQNGYQNVALLFS